MHSQIVSCDCSCVWPVSPYLRRTSKFLLLLVGRYLHCLIVSWLSRASLCRICVYWSFMFGGAAGGCEAEPDAAGRCPWPREGSSCSTVLSVASIDGVDNLSGPENLESLLSSCICEWTAKYVFLWKDVRGAAVLSCLIHYAVDLANVGYALFLWITTKDSWLLTTFSESLLLETSSRLHSFSSVFVWSGYGISFPLENIFYGIKPWRFLLLHFPRKHIVIQTLFSYINTTTHRKQDWANSYQTYYDYYPQKKIQNQL